MLHPHLAEELAYREGPVPGSGAYDRAEVELGASWLAEEGKVPRPWLLSDRDVWYKNPYYNGPEVPHPEDDCDEFWDDELLEALAAWESDYREAVFRERYEPLASYEAF